MLALHSYYRSSSSYRVRIALHHKGLKHKYHGVHLVQGGGEQHKAEYREINPQGLVPALTDGKQVITQSLAIMEYLEEKHPEPPLLPKKAGERAFARQIALIAAADIQPLTTLRLLHHMAGECGLSQAQKTEWQQKWIRQGFDAIEKLLTDSPFRTGGFCCGSHPTLADMCLIPQVYDALRLDIEMDAWPTIAAIEKHCLELESFQAASPEAQDDTPEDQRLAFLKKGHAE